MTQGRTPDHINLDARSLRALAHPDRVQILTLLRRDGTSTATRLAGEMGINSGSASYHLRRLAEAGLVAEDTERGNARERWWRSVYDRTVFDDLELARQEPEATLAYLQSVVNSHQLRIQQALSTLPTLPAEWQANLSISDWGLTLTASEAQRLGQELAEVVERYQRRNGAQAPDGTRASEGVQATDGAEPVVVMAYVLPVREPKP
ncbi:ArsR/SmtB family transcription factor [Streptomyces sp. 142MFCol3.1]|uniref:ArsR/SmtB family transcription factor n=1 Tax=Streptomyces sp. 142MFCol3.1 TaxID=1172179 RepID=UPI000403BB4A|nr:winged helix-turn-helix domain-containing protein [Streptomyces sp. 142MFCol3.1]